MEYESMTFAADNAADNKPIELQDSNGKRTLVGYAVVWGAISAPRADGNRYFFSQNTITWETPTFALWCHDFSRLLAGTNNNTLRMAEDDIGLRVEIDLDNTTDGDNTNERVANKLATGMSFGVKWLKTDVKSTPNPTVFGVLKAIGNEVTVTPIPAMAETSICISTDQPIDADVADDAPPEELQNDISPIVMKERNTDKTKLDKYKLSLLKVGRVSTKKARL